MMFVLQFTLGDYRDFTQKARYEYDPAKKKLLDPVMASSFFVSDSSSYGAFFAGASCAYASPFYDVCVFFRSA
jgi:hypothetical protein